MAQALPQFNEGTQRWHETLPEGQPGLMIKGVDAKKMIAASKPVIKPAFNKESTALAPISDVSGGEEKQTMFQKMKSNLGGFAGAENLLKGILAAVEESAMHLKDIALSIAPDSAAARDAAILGEDVGDEDGEDDDGKGEKKPGFFKRQAGKLPSFKKMAMVAIMAGIILFAEKIQPVIAIMLKVFKWVYNFLKTGFVAVWDWISDFFSDPLGTLKDSLDAVLGGLASLGAWIWDKGIKPVWDWIAGLFDSGPGKWIADKFKAVVGVFVSIGSWIWEKAIEPIWTWIKGLFGFGEKDKTQEGDDTEGEGGIGTWIWDHTIGPVWDWIKLLFTNPVEALITLAKGIWGVYASVGKWIWNKIISPIWTWIKGLFGFGDKDKTQEGDDTEGEGGLGTWIWKNAIEPVWTWIKGLFTNPVEALITLATAIWGVYKSVGLWIWNKIISPVWTWIKGLFGFGDKDKTQEGDDTGGEGGLGTWIWKNTIEPVWTWIKGLFSNPVEALITLATAIWGTFASIGAWIWEKAIEPIWNWIKGLFSFGDTDKTAAEGEEKGWSVLSLISGVFTSIKEWFQKLFKFDSTSDIITSLVNVLTFVPNMLKDLISGATQWLLSLFGFDDASKKVANATDWTFGSLITGAFKAVKKWFLGIFGWGKDDKAKGPHGEDEEGWSVSSLISGVVQGIKDWFSKMFSFDSKSDVITSLVNVLTFVPNILKDMIAGVTGWLLGLFGFDDAAQKLANATDWTFGSLITGAFKAVKKWFLGIFGWGKEESAKGPHGDADEGFSLGTWIWDHTIGPIWDFFTGLFDNPLSTITEAIATIFGAYVSIGKWIWGMTIEPVWNWIKGLFGWGEDDEDTLKDDEGNEMSLWGLAKKAVSAVWGWLTGLFTFSDETQASLKQEFGQIKTFGKAIASGAWAAIKNIFGHPIDAFKEAFSKTLETGMMSDAAKKGEAELKDEKTSDKDLSPILAIVKATQESAMHLAAMTLSNGTATLATAGAGVTIVDQSNNQSTSTTTQDTYNQSELATDHNEQSGSWLSNIDWTPWN